MHPPITEAELRALFITAAGGRKPTEDQLIAVERNRDRIFKAALVVAQLPGNRYQSLALTALEEALMWANKAVFFEPPVEHSLDAAVAAFEAEHGRKPKFGELREYPGMNGLPVAGPQWPGQAAPGQPIVSEGTVGRTLYTPVGPVRVGDVLEYWDTPSGPTSAETWTIYRIADDGTVFTHGERGSVTFAGPVLGPSTWQVGGPWRIHLPDTHTPISDKEA